MNDIKNQVVSLCGVIDVKNQVISLCAVIDVKNQVISLFGVNDIKNQVISLYGVIDVKNQVISLCGVIGIKCQCFCGVFGFFICAYSPITWCLPVELRCKVSYKVRIRASKPGLIKPSSYQRIDFTFIICL